MTLMFKMPEQIYMHIIKSNIQMLSHLCVGVILDTYSRKVQITNTPEHADLWLVLVTRPHFTRKNTCHVPV